MAVIGLDLGGTKLAGAIFSQSGQILRRAVTPLTGRRGREIGELVRLQVATLLNVARTKRIEVRAIGICVPGIARTKSGRVWAPNLPGWEDYPLRAEIVSSLGRRHMRVVVDNDRAACILGEAWQGAARGCRDAIFLAVGTGIGAGILVDGQVLRGTHDIAGSIGWFALDQPFRREYAGDCFEYHASGGGLAKVAKEILAGRKKYSSSLRNKSNLTARDVFAAYAQGDVVAKKCWPRPLNSGAWLWQTSSACLIRRRSFSAVACSAQRGDSSRTSRSRRKNGRNRSASGRLNSSVLNLAVMQGFMGRLFLRCRA